jgi:hypothetical protein
MSDWRTPKELKGKRKKIKTFVSMHLVPEAILPDLIPEIVGDLLFTF